MHTVPSSGTLALSPIGTFVYTPTLNFCGIDRFTYQANDGSNASLPATVTITVDNCINDVPLTVNDVYVTVEDVNPFTVALPGVRINDYDPENDAFTIVKDSNPSHGTLSPNTDLPKHSLVDQNNNVGVDNHLALLNGYPTIAYYDYDNGDLKVAQANDIYGVTWDTPITVLTNDDVGSAVYLTTVQGKAAISYENSTQQTLMYIQSADPQGTIWGNEPITVTTNVDILKNTVMLVVNGYPAIAYYDYISKNVYYVRANDITGSSWNAPILIANGNEYWGQD